VALGWLGWTEEQALSADVNAIEIAHLGRLEMLATVFGGEKRPKTPEQLPAFTSSVLRGEMRR